MFMNRLIAKIKKWWRKFIKDHIIDEVHPDDPDF